MTKNRETTFVDRVKTVCEFLSDHQVENWGDQDYLVTKNLRVHVLGQIFDNNSNYNDLQSLQCGFQDLTVNIRYLQNRSRYAVDTFSLTTLIAMAGQYAHAIQLANSTDKLQLLLGDWEPVLPVESLQIYHFQRLLDFDPMWHEPDNHGVYGHVIGFEIDKLAHDPTFTFPISTRHLLRGTHPYMVVFYHETTNEFGENVLQSMETIFLADIMTLASEFSFLTYRYNLELSKAERKSLGAFITGILECPNLKPVVGRQES